MKKAPFIFLLLISIVSVSFAQKMTTEKMISLSIDETHTLGNLFYADNDYLYFTVNENKKNGKVITNQINAIYKYDKNMHLVSSMMLNELFVNLDENTIFYKPLVVNGNFVVITLQPIGKYNPSGFKNKFIYSTVVMDKKFNSIGTRKEFYKTGEHYQPDPRIQYSPDSTSILLTFDRWSEEISKENMEKTFIGIDENGQKTFEKKVNFIGINEYFSHLMDVAFDSKNIYLTVRGDVKKDMGISSKTGEKMVNYQLLKYNTATSILNQIAKTTDLYNYFTISTKLKYANGLLYLAGTYNDHTNSLAFETNRFLGTFVLALDKNDKVIFSKFTPDNENDVTSPKADKGKTEDILLKDDGGFYTILEDNFCPSSCTSLEMLIYNYRNDGSLIWKKTIKKDHSSGMNINNYYLIYSYYFTYNNNVYVLFNESKDNAFSPIEESYSKTNKWDKDLYLINYTYTNDGNATKKMIFYSEDYGCRWVPDAIYLNKFLKKIYSIDYKKMSTINYE